MLRCQLNTRLVLIEENEHRLRRLCSIVKQLSLLQDTAESDEFRLRSQQLAQDAIREAIKVESFVDCAREQVPSCCVALLCSPLTSRLDKACKHLRCRLCAWRGRGALFLMRRLSVVRSVARALSDDAHSSSAAWETCRPRPHPTNKCRWTGSRQKAAGYGEWKSLFQASLVCLCTANTRWYSEYHDYSLRST